jgi:hypothetical protein
MGTQPWYRPSGAVAAEGGLTRSVIHENHEVRIMAARLVCKRERREHSVRDACSVLGQVDRPVLVHLSSPQEIFYAMDHPHRL